MYRNLTLTPDLVSFQLLEASQMDQIGNFNSLPFYIII